MAQEKYEDGASKRLVQPSESKTISPKTRGTAVDVAPRIHTSLARTNCTILQSNQSNNLPKVLQASDSVFVLACEGNTGKQKSKIQNLRKEEDRHKGEAFYQKYIAPREETAYKIFLREYGLDPAAVDELIAAIISEKGSKHFKQVGKENTKA